MTRKDLMLLAWQLVKDNKMNKSDAMIVAWENKNIVDNMRIGVVEFKFRKLDGSERIAHGTLRDDMLPETKGTGNKPHKSVQVYYDTDAKEWRCFKKDKLIKMK
jgi:hypothetical protein